jgi:uncharacterized protein YecA (UPF0149 family)
MLHMFRREYMQNKLLRIYQLKTNEDFENWLQMQMKHVCMSYMSPANLNSN